MTTEVILSEKAARALTEKIRVAVNDAGRLILEAQESKVWLSMGYETWTAYIEGEFDFGVRRAFQLLKQGKVQRALGTGEHVTAREADGVMKHVSLDGPSDAVRAALDEQRAAKKSAGRKKGYAGEEGKLASILDASRALWDAAENMDAPLPPSAAGMVEDLALGWSDLLARHTDLQQRALDQPRTTMPEPAW